MSNNYNNILEPLLAEAENKLKPKRPKLYKVILINDDYTPMVFVVEILQKFFSMDIENATMVMLQVHTNGKGVCGVYTHEIAETKSRLVNQYSRENQHPLLCDLEDD